MIYKAKFVLPIVGEPIHDGEVLVHGDSIAAVGMDLSRENPNEPLMDLGNAVILPGFVNTHTHLDYTLERGLCDDAAFFPWLLQLIQYGVQFDYNDFLASARLGALQLIRAGVTTIADATYSGAAVTATAETGLRGIVCQETFGADVPDGYEEDILSKIALLRESAGDRVIVGVSPHSPYTSSEARLAAVAKLASDHNIRIIIHVSESCEEVQAIKDGTGPATEFGGQIGVQFRATGKTPTAYLKDLGILGDRTLAAHCVHLTDEDIDILAETKTGVAHCPKSNAKLGNGIAPFSKMYARGVRVGIGTDSAASGDPLDMNDEMRFAVLLQRASLEDTYAMDARRVVEAVTLGGARALGLDNIIGTIEPGKRADITAVDLSGMSSFPISDPYSALVYSCSAADVMLTMVDGEVLYHSGEYLKSDADAIKSGASESADKLQKQAPNHFVDKFFSAAE